MNNAPDTNPSKPADQAISPISGTAPPAEHRFKPGQSGNPRGRRSAGATIREWINVLAAEDLTEDELRAVARDKRVPVTKRTAAARLLATIETGDLADFQPFLRGEKTLEQLREAGVNTEVLKRAKVTAKGEREVELHDVSGRSRAEADFICDRTDGKPKQAMELSGDTGLSNTVRIIIPGINTAGMSLFGGVNDDTADDGNDADEDTAGE